MYALAHRRRRRGQSGAAAVEMALVMFILVPLVFGIIGFGIVFAQQLALGNAARQAARYGVVADRTCAQIKAEAQSTARTVAMSGPDSVSVKVGTHEGAAVACADDEPPCEGSDPGDNVYVVVDYKSTMIVPVAGIPDFDLEGTGVFRCEFS